MVVWYTKYVRVRCLASPGAQSQQPSSRVLPPMATASTSAGASSSSRTLEPGTGTSSEASIPLSRDGGGEGDVLDLDSPWTAMAEAGSRLEEAASATAAGVGLSTEEEAGRDEIRDNLQRQEDEVSALIYVLNKLEFGTVLLFS